MSTLGRFIKWGSYKSTDQKNPDILELKARDTDTFETSYSINAEVFEKVGSEWQEAILPLKSHESKNSSLLDQWIRATKEGKIKKGMTLKIKTWLGQSKFGRPIRRFSLEF